MLAVIDYGAGNLRSVLHALKHLGIEQIQLVQKPEDMHGADQIILPGVGAFGAGMQKLHEQNLVAPLKQAIADGIPYLGICLGMQFLFEYSDEMGHHEGLGILPGHVTRFEENPAFKVPHMGWNTVAINKPSALSVGLTAESYAYFVHSYYCVPESQDDLLFATSYGVEFASGVERDNVYGVQFHPEKSQVTGLRLLTNFLKIKEVVR